VFGEYVQSLVFSVFDVGKPGLGPDAAHGQRSRGQGAILGLLRAHGSRPLPGQMDSVQSATVTDTHRVTRLSEL